jgi:hypothetical protein
MREENGKGGGKETEKGSGERIWYQKVRRESGKLTGKGSENGSGLV